MNRRQFIAGGTAAAATALAGCVDSLPGLGGDDTDSPEAVVEAYIELQEALFEEPEETQDEIDALLHSRSPQQQAETDGAEGADVFEDFEFELTEIAGVDERDRDLSADQIRSVARREFMDQVEVVLEEETIEELANAETALVDAAYSFSQEFEVEGETETLEGDVEGRYVVAVEDDEWRIVIQEEEFDE